MIRVRRIWLLLPVWVGFCLGQAFPGLIAPTPVQATTLTSRYVLRADLQGMPYNLKLRHCAPAEDTMARLILVNWDPDNSRVVYRCRPRGAY